MGYRAPPIRPALTLREVFGPDPVFNPRASFRRYGWIPHEASVLDPLTGGVLAVAGGTPTICSAGVATARGLDLLWEAGLPEVGNLLPYADEAEYYRRIGEVIAAGRPLVLQHVHRAPEIPSQSYWVARSVLAFLNNKGNLADLVPAEAVPPRQLVEPRELLALAARPSRLPLFVKAASDRTSGGGGAVILVRSPVDLFHAARKYAGCRHVVVEEFLEFKQNFCLNFAVTAGHEIHYLGAGEQLTSESGGYQGNWFEHDRRPPAEAVHLGREIMCRAAARGYRGFAGFDMGVLPDGRVKVFDLNFRVNGSTKALLVYDGVQEAWDAPRVSLLCGLQGSDSFSQMCDRAGEAVHSRIVVPMATYDPAAVSGCPGNPSVSALVLGESRNEVLAKLKYLSGRGLRNKLFEPCAAPPESPPEAWRDRRAA